MLPNRPKVLLLVHRTPYPPDRGDRIRSYQLLRRLARDADVYLGALADDGRVLPAETANVLEALCQEYEVAPLDRRGRWMRAAVSLARGKPATVGLFASNQLLATVERWNQSVRFDAVVVFCSSMMQFVPADLASDAALVVDLVDVDSQKWFDYGRRASGLKRWLFELEGRRLRRLEQAIVRQANAVSVVTEPEAQLLRDFCKAGRIVALPNGVDLDYFAPTGPMEERPASCVFVGVLDYRANVDGLNWFCEQVWPNVRRRVPAAELRLVGKNPNAAVQRLARLPGVELVGEVPDVRPYLASAELVIAPLRVARGVQNKVLEALSMQKCVVASGPAIEGIAARPGRELVQADDPADWTEQMVYLWSNPARRRALAEQGRHYVEEHHCWDRCLAPLDAFLPRSTSPLPELSVAGSNS